MKLIEFTATKNFRDIGGYSSWDGKTIKYGQIYRSDHLADLTAEDLEKFKQLGIKTVIDLRSYQEKKEKPNRLPADIAYNVLNIPISLSELQPDEMARQLRSGELSYLSAKQQMNNGYKEIIQAYSPMLKLILETIADPKNLPLLIHCTAGKDRTGVSIATLMLALGITSDDIYADYLLTNDLVLPSYDKARLMLKTISGFKTDDKTFDAVAGVEKEYLTSAFNEMKGVDGSFGDYFHSRLGMPQAVLEHLQNLLLESAHE
ncbi:MAG: tyrosine-protein phosphatase [Pseudomonadales bacterium]|nr:tyrosine-protein phosphatase [Pseudomonadales bacterium]